MRLLHYLQLIRFPNLLIMAGVIGLVAQIGVLPEVQKAGLDPVLNPLIIILLMGFTALQAAAGYTINDVFDKDTDLINRQTNKRPMDQIPYQKAMKFFNFLVIGGFFISLLTSILSGQWWLIGLFLINTILLYQYSHSIKKSGLPGNILISALCAGVILLPLLMEWKNASILWESSSFPLGFKATLLLFIFALLSSLYREIAKDAEDLKGDEVNGGKSLPILLGSRGANWTMVSIGALMAGLLIYLISVNPYSSDPAVILSLQCLLLPLSVVLYLTIRANHKRDYSRLSLALKVMMLIGILAYFHVVWIN